MKKSNHSRDIVFFLGAGFSRKSGLPIMSEFGSASIEALKSLRKHMLPKDFRNAAPILVAAGEVYEQFKEYCKKASNLSKVIEEEFENMEMIFCIAEILKEAQQGSVKLNNFPYSVDSLMENMQLWLWKVYHQLRPLSDDYDRVAKGKPYRWFIDLINKLNIADRLTVLSTNYDLVFEYFAWEKEIPCKYPIKSLSKINKIKKIEAGSQTESYLSWEDDVQFPFVCKLHGSINYFMSQRLENKDNLYVVNDLANEGDCIGESLIPSKRPAILAVDAIWNIRNKYDTSLTPAIVPPTYAKLNRYSWLADIWKKAFEAISTARLIVFIGYSMPPSDGFMRAMFNGALASRKINSPLTIMIIDKCESTIKRYSEFFKNISSENVFIREFHELKNTDIKFAEVLEKNIPTIKADL